MDLFCFLTLFFGVNNGGNKITEKNNKAGLNGKGNRWKCNEKEGWKHNGKE